MKRFYHWTDRANIDRILQGGLKPGIELGVQEQYGGIDIDHSYIYLAKNLTAHYMSESIGLHRRYQKELLAVDIPDEHPIERDYDVSVFVQGTHGFFGLLNILQLIGELGIESIDGKFDFSSRESIIQHLKEVSDERWDKIFGFYRTPLPIPPNDRYRIERYDGFRVKP